MERGRGLCCRKGGCCYEEGIRMESMDGRKRAEIQENMEGEGEERRERHTHTLMSYL